MRGQYQREILANIRAALVNYGGTGGRPITVTSLWLGGTSGSGGGEGGPPGMFIGKLPQSRVCYDTTEAETDAGSDSLVDNLNTMRLMAKRYAFMLSSDEELAAHDHSSDAEGGQNLRDLLELQLKTAAELTIGAGAVTRTQVFHTIDTQNDDATDDLVTINGGSVGDLLIIVAAHTDRTVVLKHNTGNLFLRGAADISMDDATTLYFLMYMADSKWHDLGGGGGGGASTWLALTDTPVAFTASRFVAVNAIANALELVAGAACTFETTTVEVAGWEELDRDTLTGSQASFDFTSISQNYEDLELTYRLRSDAEALSDDQGMMSFNNDTVDANYYSELLYGQDAGVGANEANDRRAQWAAAALSPSGYFAFGRTVIPRYTESEYHHASSHGWIREAGTQQLNAWLTTHWETANPITRITVSPNNGSNWLAGSEMVLRGRRKRDVVTAVTGQVVVTGNTVALMSTTTGIDATAVATTTLYTVPAGNTFIPDHVVIRVTSFTAGGKGTQAVASFGGNAATYDDYLNSITYTIAAADVFIRDSVEDTAVVTQAAADVFKIAIETGSDATTETWAVDLFGYLV